uniref:Uncharacterized protein n=1 Tax=Mucochytrium quahogii TaxID=96639 RepID=A0A7S2S561_9STRA|mmetsp:Transcript_44735/g.71493  ORF Transcript_44735/g.71493 Transcript_44735/m.71493 type:complete len:619 (-) Transcript_44735:161-2017(-)|eukprot:CAMPEP_0203751248 /NCGR_PEP_ID=MMETSP0098-20131031/5348_1 /ASSEMBLY_ACC=CAM_ASM_000208 /TAXON_ID=96639 /ORGANISM=" , Strain NY0313808BC1" /LENGTH=618 /DNA_ID=CAMNT_0050640875 /DNA_START=95 /DNA_END=1951 /DNA_ORIENTATION=+
MRPERLANYAPYVSVPLLAFLLARIVRPYLEKVKLALIDYVVGRALNKLTTKIGGNCEMGVVKRGEQEYRCFKNVPKHLGELFDLSRGFGQQECIAYIGPQGTERLSFEETISKAQAISAVLVNEFNVKPGDRVSILMSNIPEFPITFIATVSIGAIAVTQNAFWGGEEILFGLEDSASSVLIADRKRLERLASIGQLDTLVKNGLRVIVIDKHPADSTYHAGVYDFDVLMEKYKGAERPQNCKQIQPEDDACIMYTSGTTSGKPKGVVLSHQSFLQATYSFVAFRELLVTIRGPEKNPKVALITSPLFHASSFSSTFLLAFATGSKLVFLPRWNVDSAIDTFIQERVTWVGLMPAMLLDLLNSKRFHQEKEKFVLGNVGTGGSACPSELIARLHKMLPKLTQGSGWGLTETNAIGTAIGGPAYLAYPLSCGKALPIVDIKCVDIVSGNDINEPGVEGELCIRTICNMSRYWNREEDTRAIMDLEGWIRTGDIGKVDSSGYVFITDRLKDLVIRGGENISCVEVEDAIYKCRQDIVEVCVFGLPHERLGEQLCAAICLQKQADLTPKSIQDSVGKHLAKFKIPTQVFFRDAQSEPLPRGPTGKILKRQLRQKYSSSVL